MYEFIARITVYGPNGDTAAVAYESWSSSAKEVMDKSYNLFLIKEWIISGVYDNQTIIHDHFSAYARNFGCVIQVYECQEKELFEGKVGEVKKLSLKSKQVMVELSFKENAPRYPTIPTIEKKLEKLANKFGGKADLFGYVFATKKAAQDFLRAAKAKYPVRGGIRK